MAQAPNSTYSPMFPLQEQIWDRDLNIPLAGGLVKFFQDDARTSAKNVYIQSGMPGNYSYVSVGSELTLSIIGTFVNPGDGTNFIPFMWPFVGNPDDYNPLLPPAAQKYFIQVFSSSDLVVPQFTIENWPPASSGSTPASSGFNSINIKTFSTVGFATYTPSDGMKYCTIECWGAGGGGGGVGNSDPTGYVIGPCGGSGGYSRKTVDAETIGASQIVTVGAGGTAGTAAPTGGGNGGPSSVGVLCIANGGRGGAGNAGGAGATAGTGDIAGTGQTGGHAVTNSVDNTHTYWPTGGGSTSIGGGGMILATQAPGVPGTGYGSGGSGGVSTNAGGTEAGGAGAKGFVIITEYLTT